MIPLGKADDIEIGKAICVESDGNRIAVFRLSKKEFRAIDGICPHQGAPLYEGSLEGSVVVCPWHAWSFDVRTGACEDVPQNRLKTYDVVRDGEEIFLKSEE